MENSKTPAIAEHGLQFSFFNPVQFDTMQRVAKMFSNSELVPDMYKTSNNNPAEKAMANCMIAIEMSNRIGASPLMIMQNMVIIYGRPSWSSKFLIATVNTCGRFEPLKFKFTNLGRIGKVSYVEYLWDNQTRKKEAKTIEFDGTGIDNIQCIAWTTAKGGDEILESSPIDLRMAIQEGWYTKAGSKWRTMERQMLMYRTASFWTNAYAPELSMGMKTDDELHDIIDISYEDVREKVETEKSRNANRNEIGLEEEKAIPDTTAQDSKESETNAGSGTQESEKGEEKESEAKPNKPAF